MAQKKAHEVDSWLARPPENIGIVLIYGPDRGLVAERARGFAERSGLPLDDPFSVIRMDAAEAEQSPGRLTDDARTVPMFSDRRLVWLRGAGAQKSLAEEIKALAADPPADAIILIEAGDLRKGALLRTTVEQAASAMALPCYSDDARALDAVIDAELARYGFSIGLEARQLLKASLGGDRLATRGELEKLVLYCSGHDRIEIEDIRALTGDVSGLDADEAVDFVLAGRIAEFDGMFSRLLAAGTHPFVVLSAALRQFHSLQRMRAVMDREAKTPAVAVASARPPVFFSRRKLVEQALPRWPEAALQRALRRLQAAILRTRQMPDAAPDLARQTLLALAVESARAGS